MQFSRTVIRSLALLMTIAVLVSACTTNPMALGMSAVANSEYNSHYSKNIALGTMFAMEADENFPVAMTKTLESAGLLAEDADKAAYKLDVQFQDLDTEQEGHEVTGKAVVKYTLFAAGVSEPERSEMITTEGFAYSQSDRSLLAEAGIKTGLGLLMVGMVALTGVGGHNGDMISGAAQTPTFELSTEKAHRVAKEDAISKNLKEFLARIEMSSGK